MIDVIFGFVVVFPCSFRLLGSFLFAAFRCVCVLSVRHEEDMGSMVEWGVDIVCCGLWRVVLDALCVRVDNHYMRDGESAVVQFLYYRFVVSRSCAERHREIRNAAAKSGHK